MSLLLAVPVGAMIACGPANAHHAVAADVGSPQPASTETLKWADRYEDATDWRNAYSRNGKQPWASQYDYGDRQSAYGHVEEKVGTDDTLDAAESGHSYESNEESQWSSEEGDEAEYTYHYGDYGPACEYAQETDAQTDDASDTGKTEYTYEYEYNDDANTGKDEPDEHADSHPHTDPATQYPEYESAYSYESEYGYESEYDGESEYSENRDADPYRDEEDDDASESDGPPSYSEAYPSEEHTYADKSSEYTYQYEYSYPEEKYGATSGSHRAPEAGYDASSPYKDTVPYPYEYKRHALHQYKDHDDPSQQMVDAETASETEVGFQTQPDLSAWLPAELLKESDWEAVRRLERLAEEPAAARRTALNDYLRQLGSNAMDFALRLEEATGTPVLALAVDPPGAAAMLASYRLAERGELTTDQAIEMLRRGLEDLPEHWSEEVHRVTTQRAEWSGGRSAENNILDVLASWASVSWASASWASASWASISVGELGNTFRGISSRMSALDWNLLSTGAHGSMPSDGPSSNWERF
ncbi:MAG: hypothetical protein A2V70_19875 [Planctomycetes bacterium RBG_13_63_9]|nr:MAG: hypothetical protein A2V70_19875 [Planctomycetes bacterium RBG_13_63_9]